MLHFYRNQSIDLNFKKVFNLLFFLLIEIFKEKNVTDIISKAEGQNRAEKWI